MGSSLPFKVPEDMKEWEELSDFQRLFVEEYLIDLNGERAAKAAGSKSKKPALAAHRLLRNPVVLKVIKKAQRRTWKEKRLEREEVLKKLADSLHRDLHALCDENGFVVDNFKQIPKEAAAWIDGFDVIQLKKSGRVVKQKIKVRLVSMKYVLDMAMRHKGLYPKETVDSQEVLVKLDFSEIFGPPQYIYDPSRDRLEQERKLLEDYREQGNEQEKDEQ